MLAKVDDDRANALIASDKPPITYMGEVAKSDIPGVSERHFLQDTLHSGCIIPEEASICRTDLLQQSNTDIAALALDAAKSVRADNSMEKMLAHQLALTHQMAMRIGDAAMGELSYVKHRTSTRGGLNPGAATELQRLTNSMARLMSGYQQGMLTMQRLRTGGNQIVTVQHVNVGAGGQAVIGNVQAGGGGLAGGSGLPGEDSKSR
jgi:hypothetical protein